MGDTLSEALNMEPIVPEIMDDHALVPASNNVPAVINPKDIEANADFSLARKNIQDAIDISSKALQDLFAMSKQAASARVYEVLTALLEETVAANESLVNLHKTRKEIDSFVDGSSTARVNQKIETQQNLYVGSTAQLQQMLEKIEKNEK